MNGTHEFVDCPGVIDLEGPLKDRLDMERGRFGLHPRPEPKLHQRIEQILERERRGYSLCHEVIF